MLTFVISQNISQSGYMFLNTLANYVYIALRYCEHRLFSVFLLSPRQVFLQFDPCNGVINLSDAGYNTAICQAKSYC